MPVLKLPARLALVLTSVALGVGHAGAQTEPVELPTTSPVEASVPLGEALAAQLKRVEADPSLDAAAKDEAKKLLEQAVWLRQSADAHQAKAEAYRRDVETAPDQVRALEAQAQQAAATPASRPSTNSATHPTTAPATNPASVYASADSVDAAERRLAAAQARVETLTSETAELRAQLKALGDRPAGANAALAAARGELASAEAAVAVPPESSADPNVKPALAAARQAKAEAWRADVSARVEELQQEIASGDARLDLLNARRDLASARQARAEEAVRGWHTRVAQLRLAASASARNQADQLKRQSADESPAVRAAADANAALLKQFAAVTDEVAAAAGKRQAASASARRVAGQFDRAQEKLEVSGMEDQVGDILREERRALANPNAVRREAAETARQASAARLGQMQAEDQLSALSDPAAAATAALAEAPAAPAPEAAAKRQQQVRTLLESRRDLLSRLVDEQARYVGELRNLAIEQTRLADQTEKYATLLDERLLWSRSTTAIGPEWIADVVKSSVGLARGLVSPDVPVALWERGKSTLLLTLFVLLAAAALLAARPRLRKRMSRLNESVGKVFDDSFALTLRALLITAALVAPWPLLWWYLGWLLKGDVYAPEPVRALGAGLQSAGLLILLLQGFRVFCREQGVADVHLRWPEDKRRALAVNAAWLLAVALPSSILVPATEFMSDELYRNGLGRLAFLASSVFLAVFAHRLLKFKGGVLEARPDLKLGGWVWRLRYAWYALGVGGPLALTLLAAVGYYYSALTVESRFFFTIWVIVGATVLHSLAIRWLLVARRKLAVRRAREKREALAAAKAGKQASDASGDATPATVEVPSVDIATVDDQARELLRVMVFLAIAGGLWLVWRDLVPALGVLDQISLWTYSAKGEGGVETVVPITLGRLGLALGVAGLTVVAARNLPGVLEIAVLQRLSLDPGNRYAITSVSLYAIVAVGILTVFNLLGVGWGNVQWLVAALSVGLGFGLQEIVANFVSGVIVLFEQPIRVGDTVTVGSLSGTVSKIRIRATTITDWDNKELIVPNKTFITQELTNWTLSDTTTRLVLQIGVTYDVPDPERVKQILLEVATKHPLVLPQPPAAVFFLAFGDSSLNFELRVFVRETGNRLAVTHALNVAIFRALAEAEIEIPYPQRDLHLRSVSGPIPLMEKSGGSNGHANGDGSRAESAQPSGPA